MRSTIEYIEETCSLSSGRVNETVVYEYDTICIAQLKGGDLKKNDDISSRHICSCNNFVDLFHKVTPKHNFWTYDTKNWSSSSQRWLFGWGVDINIFYTLFPFTMVLSQWVFLVRFLTRQIYRILYSFSFTEIWSHWVFS